MTLRACIAATVFAAAAVAALAAQSGDVWVNARTTHFNIVSNASERDIHRTAVKLEEFVDVVSQLFGARSSAQEPVTVVAFRDDRSFRPFKPLYNGKPGNLSGWFQRSGDDMFIALDINAATEDRPYAVIFHEYTHLLTSGGGRTWPAWLLEGIAEFYSSFETQGTEARLGAPIAEHVLLLREVPMLRLGELFAVDHQSPTYNEGQRQNIFYAQSWALVHYLMLGNKSTRQPQLREFIRALSEGAEVEPAFRASFQTDYSRMETELRSYVSRQAYPGLAYRLKQASAAADVALARLPPADSLFHLGSLLLKTDRASDAEALFRKALAADPAAAGPHAGLGFVALERDQFSEAVEHLRHAVDRQSADYLVHYLYADTLHRELKGGQPAADVARRIVDAARAAIARRPSFLPAHHLAGYMYLAGRLDSGEGIRVVTETQARFPRDTRTAITLAALHANQGNYAEAKSALQSTLAHASAAEGDDARRMLQQIDARLAADERRRTGAGAAAPPAQAPPAPAASAPQPRAAAAPGTLGLPDPALSKHSQMTGVLSAIECGGSSRVLVLNVGTRPVRFGVGKTLRIFRPSTMPPVALDCGPLDLPATVYFDGGADPVLQGEAVAIALSPPTQR